MENAVSSCRLCGGILKPRARRCSTCGADLNLITMPPVASASGANAGDSASAAPDVVQSPCDTTLSKKLVPLNRKRSIFTTIGWVFLCCWLIVLLITWANNQLAPVIFSFAIVIAGVICIGISGSYKSKKKTIISEHIVQAMLEDNFGQVEYNATETFSDEQLTASGLRWTGSSGNDVFKTEYKGVTFAFSDVVLWRGSGRNQTDVLHGQLLIIDLHREFPTPLMVSELEKSRDIFSKEDRQRQLEGRFRVFCKSDELATQVLTPGFMQFLNTISESQHLFFDGKTVHYGRYTKDDFFEPCSNVRDIPAVRKRIQSEIDCIKRIIDRFLANEYLFPGEAPDSESESGQDLEESTP